MRHITFQHPAAQALLLHSSQSLSPRVRRAFPNASRHARFFHESLTCSSDSVYPTTTATTTYRISAAYSAKHHPLNLARNIYTFDSRSKAAEFPLVHDEATSGSKHSQRSDSGQDAFFVSPVGSSAQIAFGVADGVGGWADSGVDPADFSHGLCSYMARTALHFPRTTSAHTELRARQLMEAGYSGVTHDEDILAGGSTACVSVARSDGFLEVANLGDSGFLHLRRGNILYQSKPQTHAFNTPYQLSLMSPAMLARSRLFGRGYLKDMPKDADITNHDLEHGDVLLFATDGVWDNLSRQQLSTTIGHFMVASKAWNIDKESGVVVTKDRQVFANPFPDLDHKVVKLHGLSGFLAALVTREAKTASISRSVDGPFAQEMRRHFPFDGYRGGKVDDICVMVVIVLKGEEEGGHA
ncbi:MAG: hypothetical protein M1816_007514 [Peltula sp. TS41687]|nr:MAG: hypothetical protein M1816_007514 [Peltula sp. TS41687]